MRPCLILFTVSLLLASAALPGPKDASVAASQPSVIAAGEWSEPLDRLRGRMIVTRGRLLGESLVPESVVYLELQHSGEVVGPALDVYFDPSINLQLQGADGKSIPISPGPGSCGRPAAEWVRLPYDSTLRLRLSPFGFGVADGLLIKLNDQQWLIRADDPNDYFLVGAFSADLPAGHAVRGEHHVWKGTLKLPHVRLSAHPRTADAIDRLVQKLDAQSGLWLNGAMPIIRLPADAKPQDVVAQAVQMTGFGDRGHLKTYRILKTRAIKLQAPGIGAPSSALIESDQGTKILIFWHYAGQTDGWWTRFFDAEPVQQR